MPGRMLFAGNRWYSFDSDSDLAVVFVHGFFSSPSECWQDSNGVFWPDLLLKDDRVPSCSIYLAAYHTSLASGGYGVSDCAGEVRAALLRQDSAAVSAVLSKKKIIFVCHSLGGIVTRYLLEAYRADFAGKTVGLCLMASPSIGSRYADVFSLIAYLCRHRTGAQLRHFSPFLQDLDERFMRLLDSWDGVELVGAEAIEDKAPLSWVPYMTPIVPKLSAGRYFSERRTLPRTNHSSIVKPNSLNHPSHQFLVDLIRRMGLAAGKVMHGEAAKLPLMGGSPADVLFDVYEKRFELYYVERKLDKALQLQASARSVWLSGRSGTGKTCAMKRHVTGIGGFQLHISLSQLAVDAVREDIIREFAETLSQVCGCTVDASYTGIVRSLKGLREQYIVVYVDEVAASESVGTALAVLLCDVLTNWKQEAEGASLLFLVSSIDEPVFSTVVNQQKLHEQFGFVSSLPWSVAELDDLCGTVLRHLPSLELAADQRASLCESSQGSPRFLKTFFRNWYFEMNGSIDAIPTAIGRAKEQLGF